MCSDEKDGKVGCCGNKLMVRLSLGDKLMPSIRQAEHRVALLEWMVGTRRVRRDNDIIIGAMPVHKKAGICRNGGG